MEKIEDDIATEQRLLVNFIENLTFAQAPC